MEVLQLSVSKRRLNSSSRSTKLHSMSVDNSQRKSPSKLRLSSSCNWRIINRQNSSLSNSKSVDNSRRSRGKLRLSISCNMTISNRRKQPLQQQEEERRQDPRKQQMQQVQQPLQ
jgi:hypothetical protein